MTAGKLKGTVRDIRTGRALGRTDDLTGTFIDQISTLRLTGRQCYVVTGPCRHEEMRWAVDRMRESGITVIRDKQFPPDKFLLFEGEPHELGFRTAV